MITSRRVFRRQYVITAEHGSWIWWIGPMAIGFAAGGDPGPDGVLLVLALLAAFLLRQPASIFVRAIRGHRSANDRAPALFWLAVYSSISLVAVAELMRRGHGRILWLALPGVLVFARHLWLVGQKADRGRMRIELVGAGVLALSAPAAYWVAGGQIASTAWLLWALMWMQSAASIVHIYLRLGQRRLTAMPGIADRLRAGARSIAYSKLNVAASLGLALAGLIPWQLCLAFFVVFMDALEGTLRPCVAARPAQVGWRQLVVSSLFVVIAMVGYVR